MYVDGGSTAPIPEVTGRTYEIAAKDAGRSIAVRFSYIDWRFTKKSLPSEAVEVSSLATSTHQSAVL